MAGSAYMTAWWLEYLASDVCSSGGVDGLQHNDGVLAVDLVQSRKLSKLVSCISEPQVPRLPDPIACSLSFFHSLTYSFVGSGSGGWCSSLIWMPLLRSCPSSLNEQPWVASSRRHCMECQSQFTLINRKHHCRHCARILCGSCTSARLPGKYFPGGFDLTYVGEGTQCRPASVP